MNWNSMFDKLVGEKLEFYVARGDSFIGTLKGKKNDILIVDDGAKIPALVNLGQVIAIRPCTVPKEPKKPVWEEDGA